MSVTLLKRDDLPRSGHTYDFEGYLHGETPISFIWVDLPPGDGPRLHKHAYTEIIIQEGRGTFTADGVTLEATAGHILIIPAGTPHTFVNSGEGRLQQIDLHLAPKIRTEWLEA